MARQKWWGDGGLRPSAHEGLDMCLYTDNRHQTHRLNTQTRIPALYDGVVVGLMDDFLGRSVVLRHKWPGRTLDHQFLTLYGHLQPSEQIRIGCRVRAGDVIGRLASVDHSRSGVLPHLHLSVAELDGPIGYETLDWQNIASHPMMTLHDPLVVIDGPYRVLSDPDI